MEILTRILTPEQIRTEVDYIVEFFRVRGVDELIVNYGWDCNLEMDELWQDIVVAPEELPGLIDRSVADGLYPIGDADFFINDRSRQVVFLLCHESDIHCTSMETDSVEQVKKHWEDRGYPIVQRELSPIA